MQTVYSQAPISMGQNVYYSQVQTPPQNLIGEYRVVSQDYAMKNLGQTVISNPVTYTTTEPVTYSQPITYMNQPT